MDSNGNEIGYPHELILRAYEKAKNILETDYDRRTKIFAFLLLKLTEKEIKFKESTNLTENDRLLLQMGIGKKPTLRKFIKIEKENLLKLVDQYNRRPTQVVIEKISDFLKEKLFSYVYLKHLNESSTINSKILRESFPSKLLVLNPIKDILTILTIFEDKEINDKQLPEVLQIFNESILEESGLFFSLQFSSLFLEHKNHFLLSHYLLSKEIIESQLQFITQDNLAGSSLEGAFKTAIILTICGYTKSIRLSHQEKLNYINQIIAQPVLEMEFQKHYVKATKIGFEGSKIPIKIYSIIIMVIIFLGIIMDVFVGVSIENFGLFGLETSIPLKIPYFSAVAFIMSLFLTIKLFKLKKEISMKIASGEEDQNV